MESAFAVVVMAKTAVPGRVKTRLIGELTADQAAEVHAAMLACVLVRTAAHISGIDRRLVVAVDNPYGKVYHAHWPWERIDQGRGDLGQRIAQVWGCIGGGPAIFLGADTPDVPSRSLRAIAPALVKHDLVIGPTEDGGYWTMAGRGPDPSYLNAIDWGTDRVYHQSCLAARRAGLRVNALDRWSDVDAWPDLVKLRMRLVRAKEPALKELATRLNQILKDQKS